MTRWRDIHRGLQVVTPPVYEPLSLSEVKAALRIESAITADDPFLTALLKAAREKVEQDCNRSLVPTTWDLTLETFPEERSLELPRSPLQSVTSVKSTNEDAVETTMSSADYVVDTQSEPGRVCLAPDASWPSDLRSFNAGVVRFVAGYQGPSVSVSSLTRSGSTVTVTTATVHGFNTGQQVTIAGATPSAYNATWEVTVTGPTTFTFTITGSPDSPATGTITVRSLGVPARLLSAIKLLLVFWHQHRGDALEGPGEPLGYDACLDRVVILG